MEDKIESLRMDTHGNRQSYLDFFGIIGVLEYRCMEFISLKRMGSNGSQLH